ncbi:MAG: TRAP transporter large permease subunit [Pseudomonadota bacterium]
MWLLILIVILLGLLGMPLFAVIFGIAMAGFYFQDIDLSIVPIELYRLTDNPLMTALPLFTFAGYILSESRASQRLLHVTQALLGWMPGGLAIAALIACALFTALTGASGVTIVALGALLYPALKEAGYRKEFNLGLITTSGSLGLLLPPSIPLILYGIIAQQMDISGVTIEKLFLAGILPCLLMLVLLAAWSLWSSRQDNIPLEPFSGKRLVSALREAIWEIPLPIVILGGIYSGFFAISEAAAITVVYVLIVEVLIYREIAWRDLPRVIADAMVMSGGILLILGAALAFTTLLVDAEIPMQLFDWIKTHIDDKLTFLLVLNIFLLLLGAILDIFAALVIVVPLILPVAMGYDIHPIHLGIIFLANMQVGYFTPPIGMNLFIASYRFNEPVTTLYRATLPFMLTLLVALMIITYWPALSLALIE